MTEVADFKALSDSKITVPPTKDFSFTLPNDVSTNAQAVLSWVMAPGSGDATYSITLTNGTNQPVSVVTNFATPPDSARRAMHEVIDVAPGPNKLTVEFGTGTQGSTVVITDIVLWFHREV